MNRIFGINAVYESLKSNRVKKLLLDETFSNARILGLAKEQKVNTVFLKHNDFIRDYRGNTQGCVAETIPFKTYPLEEIIKESNERKNPIVVILDELNDPHNLGAILRSSDVFNVEAVIYKNHNEVQLNETVAKVSAGAINYVKCCEVTNLNQTIDKLKQNKFWIIGLAGEATSDLKSIPTDCPLAIVVGSEGYGISRLVRENCDVMVKIPMQGHVNCLNASVSCAIVLYELSTR
jgi:rRNA methylase, putative, group 3